MQIKLKDSQNFLYDSQLVKKLINLTSINKFDIVYEMGPGKGIITKETTGAGTSSIWWRSCREKETVGRIRDKATAVKE